MQDMMGGFFGLELPDYNNFPYEEGEKCAFLNSGRAAFELILQHIPRINTIWIPRFICDTALTAPQRLGIQVKRYSCTRQLKPILPCIDKNDIVLLVNYFGLTTEAVRSAAEELHGRCIVDATTALYSPALPGIPTFYSPRKFCGVADGGIACSPAPLLTLPTETGRSSSHSQYMLQRIESGAQAALADSEIAEAALNTRPMRMSRLTRRLLRSIDFETAAAQRKNNYKILHSALCDINRLNLPDSPPEAPMCYPLVCGIPDLRDTLIDAGIALPLFWPEVIDATQADEAENILARQMLPLPLDQRYDEKDMERLICIILS